VTSPYVATTAMTTAAAVVGSLGTKPDSSWYRTLDKPSWQPPPVAFPLVWTPLYASIAWSTGRATSRSLTAEDRRRMLAVTAANLTANAAWNWAFFAARSPLGGLGVITVRRLAATRPPDARSRRTPRGAGSRPR
jgi:tryptophan-rich sensory protein